MEMSRLTRDGAAVETVSREQIVRRERGQGIFIFPVQLTTSRIGNLTRLIYAPANADTFNMSTSYQKWVWEREAYINWSMATCQGSTCSELPRGLLALCRRTLGSERHRYAIA